MTRAPWIAPLLLILACATKPSGTLAITTGGEADAWSRAPAPTRLLLESLGEASAATPLVRSTLPATSLSLPDLGTGSVAAFRLTATDAQGVARLSGTTPFVALGDLDGATLPLFVQREGEFARYGAGLPASVATAAALAAPPTLALAQSRFVVAAFGAAAVRYDTAFFTTAALALPRPAASLVALGFGLLVIDAAGASWVDARTGRAQEAAAPEGGSFADVAGGATLALDDGTMAVVGATRAGAATARVLRVALDGSLSFAALSAPRAEAGAAALAGGALVVAGGSADAPALERLDAGATLAVAVPYPPRAVRGAALVIDGTTARVLGGAASMTASSSGSSGSSTVAAASERYDPRCAASCVPATAGAPLPLALTGAQAFALGGGAVLVTGTGPDGSTQAFHVDGGAAAVVTPVPLRAPRRNARALALPTGAVVVVGGVADVESYVP